MLDSTNSKKQELILFLLLMFLLLLIFVWIYLVAPFAGMGNDLVLNLIYLVFSVYPVVILRRILAFYESSDLPRRIWFNLFIGFGLFFVGDAAWSAWNMFLGEVPTPSVADIFYILAYVFLTAGLLRQYQLIFLSSPKQVTISSALLWVLSIAGAVGIVFLRSGAFNLCDFIEYLYPALDLLLALVAFYLMRTFQQGSLGRPLWGFLALFVADFVYASLVQSGGYSFLVNEADYGRLISDLVYNLSYIVFALGFWGHYATLKYGSESG